MDVRDHILATDTQRRSRTPTVLLTMQCPSHLINTFRSLAMYHLVEEMWIAMLRAALQYEKHN